MNPTILDIFRPTIAKAALTLLLAAGAHYLIVLDIVRTAAGAELTDAKSFWGGGLTAALPFLETESKPLKFVTFFLLSYLVVWMFSHALGFLDRLQLALVRKLRKHS